MLVMEKIYKCIVCGGNEYPCILGETSYHKNLKAPTKCPFGFKGAKWREVKE